jgi:hypothetical protein
LRPVKLLGCLLVAICACGFRGNVSSDATTGDVGGPTFDAATDVASSTLDAPTDVASSAFDASLDGASGLDAARDAAEPIDAQQCGAVGEACCASGSRCDDHAECRGGKCVACGHGGESCCGFSCDLGALCVLGSCVL